MTTYKNQYFLILVTMGYTQFSIAFLQSQKSFFVFKLKKFLNIFTKTQKKNIDQNKKSNFMFLTKPYSSYEEVSD